jgi:hypothetical protein
VDAYTLQLADYLPVRSYGVLIAPPVMAWPGKRAAEQRNYALDITSDLAPTRDAITSALVRVIPANTGDLAASNIAVLGCAISTTLSGGIAGTRYTVILTAGTVSGRILEYAITITVAADAAT